MVFDNATKDSLVLEQIDKKILLKIIRIQSEVVAKSFNLDQIMFLVSQRAQELLKADGGVIELREGDEMVYRAATGMAENYLGLRLKMGNSLTGLCIYQQQPLISNDSINDERADREACKRINLRSMLVVPLMFNNEVVGVLKVMSKQINNFTEQGMLILEMMSELISAAMHTAAKYGKDNLYVRATTDDLTGIKNRSVFYDALHSFIKVYDAPVSGFAVIMLDMDGLKKINDDCGHLAGDAAIMEIVRRIESQIRDSDLFCRLGGDEFGILVKTVNSKNDVQHLIQRIKQEVEKPFEYNDQSLGLGVSIGSAYFTEDANELNQLIELADRRMYQDKRQRKSLH